MSYFIPPDLPDRKYYIFGEGGGKRTADELGVDFLGEIPIDPRVVEGGDAGRPIVTHAPDSAAAEAFRELVGMVARKLAVIASRTSAPTDANIIWSDSPG
jgi:ATP-binding protein involved in chromosome partitioning